MALNPYDSCPCGSGKKFKWCCAGYFDRIELALDQQQQGQHDAAIATMQALTRQHPDRPQVWGYYAHILFAEGKTDEAEGAIEKAFALQPDFAMGHLLRGLFRQSEGEVIGSLLLFRKAAEAYNPEAHDQLAQVHEMIARTEVMLNRPVAARAALEVAVHHSPADAELRQQFDALFGEESRLPLCARKKYAFRPMTRRLPADAATGKLSDARKAFERLAAEAADDPAVWFNLGLVRAWLGEQPGAVEALNKSVELEADDYRAEEAAALAAVLRCGQGMENDADYVEHRVYLPVRDPQAVSGLLQAWIQEGRLLAPQMDEQGTYFSALMVEELPTLLDTGTRMAKVVANLAIAGGLIRLWHVAQDAVAKIGQEVRDRLNLAVGEPSPGVGPVQFGDVPAEALAYPTRTAQVAEAEGKLRDYAANFYENVWPDRPLRSLGGAGPRDAVGSSLMRKRVLGAIRFQQDCLAGAAPRKRQDDREVPIEVYDFDRLRHKLGIEMKSAPAPAAVAEPEPPPPPLAAAAPTPAPAAPAKREFSAMSAAELAGLPLADLSAGELEEAMRAAIALKAHELAVAIARAGATKPADAGKPDRYPFYACLMTGAVAEGKPAEAARLADDGAAFDAAHNAGRRATDYGLRKAAVLLKGGDAEAAAREFDAILERNPDDGNLYVKAAEAMLGAKNGAKAAHFAEKGVARAKALGSRDLEGACQELLEAAKRYK
jgi:tetratricopeptide (TPR) repeat protein